MLRETRDESLVIDGLKVGNILLCVTRNAPNLMRVDLNKRHEVSPLSSLKVLHHILWHEGQTVNRGHKVSL